MEWLTWMAWTTPVAIFFASIGLLLLIMTIWELRSPTVARKGFLPMMTTRGDRLFISLIASAYINLAWIGLTELTPWWAVGISAAVLGAVMRWG